MLNWIDLIREVFHALGWRNDERYHARMCASPVGNVFVKDFVEFMVTGKKVTGRVHDFICLEEKVGVFVNVEALEQYPNQCGLVKLLVLFNVLANNKNFKIAFSRCN